MGRAGEEGPGAGAEKAALLSYQETHPVSVWLPWPGCYLLQLATPSIQLTKNSLKNNHFLSAEWRWGGGGGPHARTHTDTHAHALPRHRRAAFQD